MGKKKGFTLVELIAVIGIAAIFGAIVLGISTTSGKLFTMTKVQSAFNDDARFILNMLEDDLRVGKDIDIQTLRCNGSTNITVNGTLTGSCSSFNLPAGTFDIVLRLNVRGDLYYYIKVGNRLERKKFGGVAFKPSGEMIGEIKEFKIEEKDKKYLMSIEFENSNGENAKYKSSVMPRNQR